MRHQVGVARLSTRKDHAPHERITKEMNLFILSLFSIAVICFILYTINDLRNMRNTTKKLSSGFQHKVNMIGFLMKLEVIKIDTYKGVMRGRYRSGGIGPGRT